MPETCVSLDSGAGEAVCEHGGPESYRVFYFQNSDKRWEEIDLNNAELSFPCLFFHCKYLYTTDQRLGELFFVKMSYQVT